MKIEKDGLSQQPQKILDSILNGEENCPSCLEFLPEKATECPSCGILLSNFKRVSLEKRVKISTPTLGHLSSYQCVDLENRWAKVMASYSQREVHDQFLQFCYQLRALSYVVFKYSQLLKIDPSDDVAEYMLKRTRILAEQTHATDTDELLTDYLWSSGVLRLFGYTLYLTILVGLMIDACVVTHVLDLRYLVFGTALIASGLVAQQLIRRVYRY